LRIVRNYHVASHAFDFTLVADYIFDFIFLLDFIGSYRFFGFTHTRDDGKKMDVVNSVEIKQKYDSERNLWLDIITCFPLEVLGPLLGTSWALLRTSKFLHFFHLFYYINRIKDDLENHGFAVSLDADTAVKLFVVTMTFTHFFSCFWGFLLLDEEGHGFDDSWYLSSFYWSLVTMTTTGYGDLTPTVIVDSDTRVLATLYTIMVIFMGTAVFAGVVANVASMMHTVVISRHNIHHQVACAEQLVADRQLPTNIAIATENFFMYWQKIKQGINEELVLGTQMPQQMKRDITLALHSSLLSEAEFFYKNKVGQLMIRNLVIVLEERIVTTNDVLMGPGVVCEGMYFLKDGLIMKSRIKDTTATNSCDKNNELLIRMHKGGDCIAEIALFDESGSLSKKTKFMAMENSLLMLLPRQKFQEIMSSDTECFDRMQEFCLKSTAKSDEAKGSVMLAMPENKGRKQSRLMSRKRSSKISFGKNKVVPLTVMRETSAPPVSRLKEAIGLLISADGTFAPDGPTQACWNLIIFILELYNFLKIPFVIAMSWNNTMSSMWIFDYIGDLFFIVDIVFRASFFEYMDGDLKVKKRSKIFEHYCNKNGRWWTSNMFMDVLSVVPFELCVAFIPSDDLGSKFNKVQCISLLRFLKLIRMRRVSHHFNSLDSFNETILGIPVNYNALKLMQMVVLIMFSAHWFGCGWFLLARLQYTMDTWAHGHGLLPTLCTSTNGTIATDGSCAREIVDQYVSSVYWATFTLTTVGYGDITPVTHYEQLYAIVTLIIGTFIYTFIIAILEEIVAQVDVTSSLHQQRIEEVKSYLLIRQIPANLQDKILGYYDILWARRKGATPNEVMKFLSPTLNASILQHDLKEPLRSLCGIDEFSAGEILQLMQSFVPELFLPGDILYERGACATELLVIADGNVMLTADGKVSLKNETKGSILGYAEFINKQLHTCMAKAASMTNVYALSYVDFCKFIKCIDKEKEWANILTSKVQVHLQKHNMANSLAKNVKKGGKMSQMMALGTEESSKGRKKVVFRPSSITRNAWDTLFFLYIIFQVAIVPIGIAFRIRWHYYLPCTDAFLLLNVYLNMRRFAFVTRNGALLADRGEFQAAYLHSWSFVMDVVVTVPIDLIAAAAGVEDPFILYCLRLTKMLYVSRISSLIQKCVDVLEENQITLNSGIVNAFRMFIFIVLCCHCLACGFYLLAAFTFINEDPSWVKNDPLLEFETAAESWGYSDLDTMTRERTFKGNPGILDISSRYIRSFYWSTYTITTVGYGDVKPVNVQEKLLAICGMLIGAVLCDAGITAILTSFINNQDLNAGKNSRRTKCLKMYMAHRGISSRLQREILEYFVFVKIEQQDLDERKILTEMPSSLRGQIMQHLCFHPMRRHVAYKQYTPAFVSSLVKKMEPYIAMPYEWLFIKDEMAQRVLVMVRGQIEYSEATKSELMNRDKLRENHVERERRASLGRRMSNGAAAATFGRRNTSLNPMMNSMLGGGNIKSIKLKKGQALGHIGKRMPVTARSMKISELFVLSQKQHKAMKAYLKGHEERSRDAPNRGNGKNVRRTTMARMSQAVNRQWKKALGHTRTSVITRAFISQVGKKVSPHSAREILCLVTIIYNVCILPLRWAFLNDYDFKRNSLGWTTFFILDYGTDLLCAIDFSLRYMSADKMDTGNLENNLLAGSRRISEIRRGSMVGGSRTSFRAKVKTKISGEVYRQSWDMYVDIWAFFPIEILLLAFRGLEVYAETYVHWRLNRLLKIFRFRPYCVTLHTILENNGMVPNVSIGRMWILFSALVLIGHWCGCIFYWLSRVEAKRGNLETWGYYDGLWAAPEGADPDTGVYALKYLQPVGMRYSRSIYWAFVCLVTTGFGDIVPKNNAETIFTILTMYAGLLISTSAVANLTLLVANIDSARSNFTRKLESITKFCYFHSVPQDLTKRVLHYYEYMWRLLKGIDENQFLKDLPPPLQHQVNGLMIRELIVRVDIMRKASASVINGILQPGVLGHCVYSPGDEIVKLGENPNGCYLMSRGVAELVGSDGVTITGQLERGDCFASSTLFFPEASEKALRAKSYCELFVITPEKLDKILQSHCNEAEIEAMKVVAIKNKKSEAKRSKFFGTYTDLNNIGLTSFQRNCLRDSSYRQVWTICRCLFLIFYCFSVPLYFSTLGAINPNESLRTFHNVLSYTVDLCFVVDLLFRFTFFARQMEGLTICDPSEIRSQFMLKSKFDIALEIVVVLPFDLIFWLSGRQVYVAAITRLPKLIQLRKLPSSMSHVEKLGQSSKIAKDITLPMKRIAALNFIMVLVCHYTACLWLCVGQLSYSSDHTMDSHPTEISSWIEADTRYFGIDHQNIGGSSYLRSFYFSIVAMSTLGYGDIVPTKTNMSETIFVTFVILIGGLVLPAVVGGLASLMGSLNPDLLEFKRKMNTLREFMIQKKFPSNLSEKILHYYDYMWSRQGGVDDTTVVNDLPPVLRAEMAAVNEGKVISSAEFLEGISTELLNGIMALSKLEVFLPGDVIMECGDYGRELYFVVKGVLYVEVPDQKDPKKLNTVAILQAPDFFGESSLLGGNKRTATVRAHRYCECLALAREDFETVMIGNVAQKQMILDRLSHSIEVKKSMLKTVKDNLQRHPKLQQRASQVGKCDYETDSHSFKHPHSLKRSVWNTFLFAILLWNLLAVPFRIAFDTTLRSFAFDWILDAVFICDFYLHARYFAFVKDGVVYADDDSVCGNFKANLKISDVAAMVPLDLVCLLVCVIPIFSGKSLEEQYSLDTVSIMAIFRVTTLFHVQKFDRFHNSLETTVKYFERFNKSILELGQLVFAVILIAHWAACMFYYLGRAESLDPALRIAMTGGETFSDRYSDTWLGRQHSNGFLPADGGSQYDQYLRALNWAIPTLVVVVIGDVVPVTLWETLFCLLWMLLGVTINGAIIGSIASVVANLETEFSLFVQKHDALQEYMHQHNLSADLRERARHYLDCVWSSQLGRDTHSFIDELPVTLRVEVSRLLRRQYIDSCEYFSHCDYALKDQLALALKPQLHSVGDVIVQSGDLGEHIYFIESGSVEVISPDGLIVFASIEEGNFFGESGVFEAVQRMATVRAANFCALLSLSRTDFLSIFSNHDDQQEKVLAHFHTAREHKRGQGELIMQKKQLQLLKRMARTPTWFEHVQNFFGLIKRIPFIQRKFVESATAQFIWEICGITGLVYFMMLIPFRFAFMTLVPRGSSNSGANVTFQEALLPLDYVVDLYFLCDVIVRLNFQKEANHEDVLAGLAAAGNKPKAAATSSTLAKFGLEGGYTSYYWVVIDTLASLPYDLLVFTPLVDYAALPLLRLPHLLRLLRLGNYLQHMLGYMHLWRVRVSAPMVQLAKMLTCYLVVNHWVACIWFSIHRYLETGSAMTWATIDGIGEVGGGCSTTIAQCYIRSIYYTITTLSSVGYGDIRPTTNLETGFQLAVVLTGACMLAAMIGSFAALFQWVDSSGPAAFKAKLSGLRQYMMCRQLPSSLQKSILHHHQMLWERQKCLDEDLVLEGLPFPLRMDIAAQVNRGIIGAVPLFRDAHISLQKRIALALRPQICAQNEFVYETGDIGFEIYFILYGKIMIMKSTDTSKLDHKSKRRRRKQSTQAVLVRGSHFGESTMGTITGVRCESARAMDFCDLYSLTKPKLEHILSVLHGLERLGFIAQIKKMKGSTQHKAVVDFAASIPGFDRGSLKGESFMYRTCSWSNMTTPPNKGRIKSTSDTEKRFSEKGESSAMLVGVEMNEHGAKDDFFMSPDLKSERDLGSMASLLMNQPILEVDDEMSDSDSSDISDHGLSSPAEVSTSMASIADSSLSKDSAISSVSAVSVTPPSGV